MRILFLCKELTELAKNIIDNLVQDNELLLIFSDDTDLQKNNLKKFSYKINKNEGEKASDLLKPYEAAILHSRKTYKIMKNMSDDCSPDLIIGLSQGNTLFVKDVFEDAPFYYFLDGEYGDYTEDANTNLYITCAQAHVMSDLCYCDKAFSFNKSDYEIFSKRFPEKVKFMSDFSELQNVIKNAKGEQI